MAVESNPKPVRKTLGLTGITLNAMALTAPGAFLWLLYQVQAAASFDGVADIWQVVLLAFGFFVVFKMIGSTPIIGWVFTFITVSIVFVSFSLPHQKHLTVKINIFEHHAAHLATA